MKPILTNGFVVTYHGDPSAGIFSQKWTINGTFSFDVQKDLEAFKQKIAEPFEWC